MTFASLAQFFSKKTIDKQKRIGNRSVGANNFQIAVARSCRRIVAGFLLPSIHRRWESGHSNVRGCLSAVVSSRHPRSNSLRLACVDAEVEARLRWVEWQAEKSVNGRHVGGVRP